MQCILCCSKDSRKDCNYLLSILHCHSKALCLNVFRLPDKEENVVFLFEWVFEWCKLFFLKDLARGLAELLGYEGNVEEDFYLTFQVEVMHYSYFLYQGFNISFSVCDPPTLLCPVPLSPAPVEKHSAYSPSMVSLKSQWKMSKSQ